MKPTRSRLLFTHDLASQARIDGHAPRLDRVRSANYAFWHLLTTALPEARSDIVFDQFTKVRLGGYVVLGEKFVG